MDEIRDAEIMILRSCQQEAFTDEYSALIRKKAIPVNSNLRVLNPRLDEDGVIRSDSRLVNSEHLPFDTRYPIILPRKHSVTRLIVKLEHEEGALVSGTNRTLSELSKRYWILSAREAIREWEHLCMTCKRRTSKAATQLLAPLPASRVRIPDSLSAFAHTALDFAGPFTTVQCKGRCHESLST